MVQQYIHGWSNQLGITFSILGAFILYYTRFHKYLFPTNFIAIKFPELVYCRHPDDFPKLMSH